LVKPLGKYQKKKKTLDVKEKKNTKRPCPNQNAMENCPSKV